jgi:hypothetical protein
MNDSAASTMRRTRLDAFETTGPDSVPVENMRVKSGLHLTTGSNNIDIATWGLRMNPTLSA